MSSFSIARDTAGSWKQFSFSSQEFKKRTKRHYTVRLLQTRCIVIGKHSCMLAWTFMLTSLHCSPLSPRPLFPSHLYNRRASPPHTAPFLNKSLCKNYLLLFTSSPGGKVFLESWKQTVTSLCPATSKSMNVALWTAFCRGTHERLGQALERSLGALCWMPFWQQSHVPFVSLRVLTKWPRSVW